MTKEEFVKAVSVWCGEPQRAVKAVIDAARKVIISEVISTGRFSLVDFGVFKKVHRAARTTNSFGKGPVTVPARNGVKFSPAPSFTAKVNE